MNTRGMTAKERNDWMREQAAFEVVYADDELYARHLRRVYGLEILDELPDGWHLGIDGGFGFGLRGNWDLESKYLWCENMPMYRNAYPGDWHKNEGYRQALVRR